MSRLHVITGSASGIGAATVERLLANGHKVIGVDIQNADVTADLSTPVGRNDAIEQVKALAPDGIDGILTSAGSANFDSLDVLVAPGIVMTPMTMESLSNPAQNESITKFAPIACSESLHVISKSVNTAASRSKSLSASKTPR